MNQFGGDWTKIKIEILVEYAAAYLNIMNVYAKRYNWKLLYFYGFAGSGEIIKVTDDKIAGQVNVDFTIGAARRIIEIDTPKSFDEYYFVEKDITNFKQLEKSTKNAFPKKKIFAIQDDCNKKCLIYLTICVILKIRIIEHLLTLTLVACKLSGDQLNAYEGYH